MTPMERNQRNRHFSFSRKSDNNNIKMAGGGEWFSIGSVVACKTCFNKEVEGEVLAFDPQTKMLILSILLM